MTEEERDAELGRLLRERATLRETLACLRSKLATAGEAFGQASHALKMSVEWPVDNAGAPVVVPAMDGVYDMEKPRTLPDSAEFARWLREKRSAETRLATINNILPD